MAARQKYLCDLPTGGEIARVASQIIRSVKADHPNLTNAALAVMIGAKDADVIARLENAETAKVPASLIIAIGAAFDDSYIQPFMALMGLKAIRQHCAEAVNALPAIIALAAKLAGNIRDGGGIDHIALAAMLPELREVDGVISALRARASDLGLAA